MLNTKSFIERSIEIHDKKYDYDKVEYFKSKQKVIITCKIHGDFEQTPNAHLNGQGCKKCAGVYKMNKEEFINKSNLVHLGRYTYDKVLYDGLYRKIILTCKIHGDFEQIPSNHLKGHGCSSCNNNKKSNTQEFIKKSIMKYGDIYSYDFVNYSNCEKKVKIVCRTHGPFYQTPYLHLNSNGCSKCAGKHKLDKLGFMTTSKEIHNDSYIYDEVKYINNKTKVKIICKTHGEFEQTPNHHMRGIGCPICKSSKGELEIKRILEINDIGYKRQFKFDNLSYKSKLIFDFAIFDKNNNLKYLIEYNGIQHYKRSSIFHKDEKDFKLSKIRDRLKRKYCSKYNISLLIIKYNENISNKLKKIINEFKE